jgi:hypothetical protein
MTCNNNVVVFNLASERKTPMDTFMEIWGQYLGFIFM